VGHLSIGRIGNRIGVVFKTANTQQPIMIGRLLGRRYAQPFAIGIEGFWHAGIGGEHGMPKARYSAVIIMMAGVVRLPVRRSSCFARGDSISWKSWRTF
jgi:hypothetical protein